MADGPVIHIAENSPEHVAYQLMVRIQAYDPESKKFDRQSILDLYAECLRTVRNPEKARRS